ncbi:hypothetical protein FNF29_02374 [Cafeteria roenbergensis]|uniref:Uncharacterized protein n=1 Tax=Cafeteria roenbergensis TaxID=33653 RepID=A0A5A8CPS7_CAFRO|nr:hypothetical protein FNF29_02374 [Cafeteria roenbergensis]|eukprot:KAA0154497.1 hypothetical protein FNF29_02374 [Cafeteria roenbergensis]
MHPRALATRESIGSLYPVRCSRAVAEGAIVSLVLGLSLVATFILVSDPEIPDENRLLAVEGASGLFVAAVAGIAYLLTACMVRCVTASAVSLGWAACSQTVRARLVSATIGFTVIARVYAREGHLDDAQGQGDDTEDGTGDMGPWVAVVEPHNEEQVWATGCRHALAAPGEGAAYSSADVRAAPGGEAAAGTAPAEAAFSSFGYWGARAVDAGRSLGRAAITLRPLPAEASAADAAKRSLLPGGSPPVSAELSIALHASLMAALRPTPGLSPGQAGSPAGSAAPALGPDSTASTDEGSRILAAPETVSWVGAAPRAAGASTGAGSVGFQVRHFVTYPVVEPATLLQAVDEVSAAGAEEVEARVAGLAERAEAAALLRGRRDPAATPPADGPGPALGAVRSDGSVGEAAAELCDSLHERFHHPCVSFLARPVVGASRAGGGAGGGGVGAEEFFVVVPLSDAEDEEGVAGLTAGASDEELGRSAGRRDGGRAAAALGSPLLLRGAEAPAGGTVEFRPTMDAYDAFAVALPLTVIAFATLRLACRAAGVDTVASGGTPAGATCLGLARFGEEPAEPWSALLGQERAAEDELPVALEDMKRVLESRLLDVARAPLIGRGTRRRLPVQGDEDGA